MNYERGTNYPIFGYVEDKFPDINRYHGPATGSGPYDPSASYARPSLQEAQSDWRDYVKVRDMDRKMLMKTPNREPMNPWIQMLDSAMKKDVPFSITIDDTTLSRKPKTSGKEGPASSADMPRNPSSLMDDIRRQASSGPVESIPIPIQRRPQYPAPSPWVDGNAMMGPTEVIPASGTPEYYDRGRMIPPPTPNY